MPPGLTANLEKEEFINLVGFLSKLGESGNYRVPNALFVRRWKVVSRNKELSENIRREGLSYVVKNETKISLQPIYSKVSGDLPVEELPVIEVNPSKAFSFVRFEIEVLRDGYVTLPMNSTTGVTAWVGQNPLKLQERGIAADLSGGIHQITLAIDRKIHRSGPLNIQIQNDGNSTAQTRLVMGR
jgi:hypothetical protein